MRAAALPRLQSHEGSNDCDQSSGPDPLSASPDSKGTTRGSRPTFVAWARRFGLMRRAAFALSFLAAASGVGTYYSCFFGLHFLF